MGETSNRGRKAEVQIKAEMQAQMQALLQAQMQAKQADFELKNAKLKAEQRRQGILARSSFREGSQMSDKIGFPAESPAKARDPIWLPFFDVARRWTIKSHPFKLVRLMWVTRPLVARRTRLSLCMWLLVGGVR